MNFSNLEEEKNEGLLNMCKSGRKNTCVEFIFTCLLKKMKERTETW